MFDAARALPVTAHPAEAVSHHAHASSPHPGVANAQVEIRSEDLLHGTREVVIRHGCECYRLRHTRNDKLILTK